MRSRRRSVWLLAMGAWSLGVAVSGAASAEWTVLAYLSGDGSLEPVALEYMARLAATPGTDRVSVAAQIDRGAGFSAGEGDFEDARRVVFEGVQQRTPRRWRWSDWRAEVNMGDPATLVEFLSWGARTLPADRYLVLLVGHGSGVRPLLAESGARDQGVAYDATSDGDSLTPAEFAGAGAAITQALGGKRIALLALDACFSASAEMAVEAASCAEVMCGSPNLLYEPGVPWDQVLQTVCETGGVSGEEVGAQAVAAVRDSQLATGQARGSYAAARLTNAAEFEAKLRVLAEGLRRSMQESAPVVTAARAQATRGGLSEEMLDARGFLEALAERAREAELTEVAAQAREASEALDRMIVASYADGTDGQGDRPWTWAMFFPPNLTAFPADYLETGHFARESGWGAFLEAYLEHLQHLLWGT